MYTKLLYVKLAIDRWRQVTWKIIKITISPVRFTWAWHRAHHSSKLAWTTTKLFWTPGTVSARRRRAYCFLTDCSFCKQLTETQRFKDRDFSLELHSFFIRMLFSLARLNILIFPPILGCKYSFIILNNSLWHFRFRMHWGINYSFVKYN